jgi:hypothetical protein
MTVLRAKKRYRDILTNCISFLRVHDAHCLFPVRVSCKKKKEGKYVLLCLANNRLEYIASMWYVLKQSRDVLLFLAFVQGSKLSVVDAQTVQCYKRKLI